MAYGINNPVALPNALIPVNNQGLPSPLSVDNSGNLRARLRSESVLGDLVVNQRWNQVELNFGAAGQLATATLITQYTANGGAIVQSNGMANLSTGVNAAGVAQLISVQSN